MGCSETNPSLMKRETSNKINVIENDAELAGKSEIIIITTNIFLQTDSYSSSLILKSAGSNTYKELDKIANAKKLTLGNYIILPGGNLPCKNLVCLIAEKDGSIDENSANKSLLSAINHLNSVEFHTLSIPIFTDDKGANIPCFRNILTKAIQEYENNVKINSITRIVVYNSLFFNLNTSNIYSKSPKRATSKRVKLPLESVVKYHPNKEINSGSIKLYQSSCKHSPLQDSARNKINRKSISKNKSIRSISSSKKNIHLIKSDKKNSSIIPQIEMKNNSIILHNQIENKNDLKENRINNISNQGNEVSINENIKDKDIAVVVVCGDISKEEADVIAAETTTLLKFPTLCGRQLKKKAGPILEGIMKKKYRELIQKYKKICPRDIFVTHSTGLNCKMLIHRVITEWASNNTEMEGDLKDDIAYMLEIASDKKMRSIALPLFYIDKYGARTEKSAELMMNAIKEYIEEFKTNTYLEEIRLVLPNESCAVIFQNEFRRAFSNSIKK